VLNRMNGKDKPDLGLDELISEIKRELTDPSETEKINEEQPTPKQNDEQKTSSLDIQNNFDDFCRWVEDTKPDLQILKLLIKQWASKPNLTDDQRNRLKKLNAKHEKSLSLRWYASLAIFLSAVIFFLIFGFKETQKPDTKVSIGRLPELQLDLSYTPQASFLKKETLSPLDAVLIDAVASPSQQTPLTHAKPKPTLNTDHPVWEEKVLKDFNESTISFPFEGEALVSTPVLASPSLTATIVGYVDAGGLVLVVGEAGNFYRISSKSGRDGYILKQDCKRLPAKKSEFVSTEREISPFSPEAVSPYR